MEFGKLKEMIVYKPEWVEIMSWILISLVSIATVYIDHDDEGPYLEIYFPDACIMFASTISLLYGLKQGSPIFTIPWLLVSLYSMITCQYFSLEIISACAYHAHSYSLTASIALAGSVTSLALKLLLWGKILKLAYPNFFTDSVETEDTDMSETEKIRRKVRRQFGIGSENVHCE